MGGVRRTLLIAIAKPRPQPPGFSIGRPPQKGAFTRAFEREKFFNAGPVDGTLLANILFGDRRGSAEGWRINASAAELGETYDET
jgi:hypothetical protein